MLVCRERPRRSAVVAGSSIRRQPRMFTQRRSNPALGIGEPLRQVPFGCDLAVDPWSRRFGGGENTTTRRAQGWMEQMPGAPPPAGSRRPCSTTACCEGRERARALSGRARSPQNQSASAVCLGASASSAIGRLSRLRSTCAGWRVRRRDPLRRRRGCGRSWFLRDCLFHARGIHARRQPNRTADATGPAAVDFCPACAALRTPSPLVNGVRPEGVPGLTSGSRSAAGIRRRLRSRSR